MINILTGCVAIIGTIFVYLLAKRIYERFPSPFLLPIVLSLIIIIIILLVCHISYDSYMIGGRWLHELLGPAVVALAYPLYQQRKLLKKHAAPILIGSSVGAVIGVVTGVVFTKIANFDLEIIYTVTPKSVTTPVAMSIVESLDGITSLAAVFVMIAGIGGTMLSSFLCTIGSIHHPIGRSIGLGCASHVIGITKSLEQGQEEGAVSTITMIVSAVFVSVITPIMMMLLI